MILSDGISKYHLLADPQLLIWWLDTVQLNQAYWIVTGIFPEDDWVVDYLLTRIGEEGDRYFSI